MTRTVHYGAPSQHEKECFTRVLKGHIALASAVFPNKTKGHCVDSFARQHLWQVNLIREPVKKKMWKIPRKKNFEK